MLSCSFTFIQIIVIYAIFENSVATATEAHGSDDDFVLYKRDVEYCHLYPWKTKAKPTTPTQCHSPVTIDRQTADVHNESTVTFVNYHKSIPDNVRTIRTQNDAAEKCGGSVTTAIFVDPAQNLHAILKRPGEADAIYNLYFINIHLNCAEHKFQDRSSKPVILEAQFVHHRNIFQSVEEAMRENLGVYIYSIAFEKELMSEISKYRRAVQIYHKILSRPKDKEPLLRSWKDIFPANSPSYVFQYVGSAANPPCGPSVIWHVDSPEPIHDDPVKALERNSEYVDEPTWAEQTYDEWEMPSSTDSSRLSSLMECGAECELPACRDPVPADKTHEVRRIRLIVGSGPATRIGKIVAAVLILIVLVVSICITIILRFILVAIFLIVLALIVLAVFGIIW